jgi:diaminopimelate decarboxylase
VNFEKVLQPTFSTAATYELPLDLAVGDTIDCLSAGVYTASVAAVAFNAFPPIITRVI